MRLFAPTLLSLATVGSTVHAAPHGKPPRAAAEGHLRNAVGVSLVYLIAYGHEETPERMEAAGLHTERGTGVRGYFEHLFIDNWLEVELDAAVVPLEDKTIFPFELMLKKPFEISEYVAPFVGIGPALSAVSDGGTHVYVGGSVAAGTYVWFGHDVGADVEVDYNVLAEHGVTQEVMVAAGPAVRF